MVGGGLFAVTGIALGMTGPAVIIAFLLAGSLALANALSCGQLAAQFPGSGGVYLYAREVFNGQTGFAAGWLFLISKLSVGGAVAWAFARQMEPFLPGLDARIVATCGLVVATVLNLRHVTKTGALNLAIVGVTLATLLYFVVSMGLQFDLARWAPFWPADSSQIFAAAAILFFAFTGYARLLTLGEDVENPEKTLPRAVIGGIAVVIVLYLLVVAALVGGADAATIAGSESALHLAAQTGGLPGTATVLAIGGITATFGVLLTSLWGTSQMVMSMAREAEVPSGLAARNAVNVPARGVLLVAGFVAAGIWVGTLPLLVKSAALAILFYYAIANLAALRFRPDRRFIPQWVSVLGLAGCLALTLTLSHEVWIGVGAMFLIGLVIRQLSLRQGR